MKHTSTNPEEGLGGGRKSPQLIRDLTTGKSFTAEPFPAFIQRIIAAGGLVEAAKQGIFD